MSGQTYRSITRVAVNRDDGTLLGRKVMIQNGIENGRVLKVYGQGKDKFGVLFQGAKVQVTPGHNTFVFAAANPEDQTPLSMVSNLKPGDIANFVGRYQNGRFGPRLRLDKVEVIKKAPEPAQPGPQLVA